MTTKMSKCRKFNVAYALSLTCPRHSKALLKKQNVKRARIVNLNCQSLNRVCYSKMNKRERSYSRLLRLWTWVWTTTLQIRKI